MRIANILPVIMADEGRTRSAIRDPPRRNYMRLLARIMAIADLVPRTSTLPLQRPASTPILGYSAQSGMMDMFIEARKGRTERGSQDLNGLSMSASFRGAFQGSA